MSYDVSALTGIPMKPVPLDLPLFLSLSRVFLSPPRVFLSLTRVFLSLSLSQTHTFSLLLGVTTPSYVPPHL